MPTINAPAQRVELLADGQWRDVTTAARGFAQPTNRVEEETGRPLTDQLRLRLIVPLLRKLDLSVEKLEQTRPLYLRLTLFDAGEGNSAKPPQPWFFGRVVELNRATELTAGDLLDLTAHDLLDAANEVAPPQSLCTAELLRYDSVLRQLTQAAGLPLGEHDGRGLLTEKPYLSHHPRPLDSSPENRVRALCWWAEESLLLCGVFESVVACDPATGESWLLAVPPGETADPPHRHIESLWLDGNTLHGVLLPTLDAPPEMDGKIFSFDLSEVEVGSAKAATYQLQTTAFRLWSAGRAEVVAQRYNWLDSLFEPSFIAAGYAIGTIGPEYDDLALDTDRPLFDNGVAAIYPPYWYVGLPDESHDAYRTTERPWLMGRNLFLPSETRVTASYDEESPFRQAEVTAYRMPGSRGYFVPDGDGYPRDLGNGVPHSSKVGELPLTLPAGYYAFISHGRPRYDDGEVVEQVAGFTLCFSRNSQRPAIAAPLSQEPFTSNQLLSGEDIVNRNLSAEPLGPLAIVVDGVDEFERLWFRDLSTNERSLVSGFGDRAIGIQLARADEKTVYVAYSRADEVVGSQGRRQSRLSLVIGRAVFTNNKWQYSVLHEVSADSADYAATALGWDAASRSLCLGVSRQTRRWHSSAGARVHRVFTQWESEGMTLIPTTGWVWLDGYHKDDFAIGDRIRLLPAVAENLPYEPLPRTIREVDWHEGRWTRLRITPAPDVSDGHTDPDQRRILFSYGPLHSMGAEEYWAEFPSQFPDGPPTLQREATASETAHFLYRYDPAADKLNVDDLNSDGLTICDDSQEAITESLAAKEDGAGRAAVVKLSKPFCQAESIRLTAGGREVEFTIDEAARAESGEFHLLVHRRYRGRELSASYDYHDPTRVFSAIVSTAAGIFYSRGAELRSFVDGASGTTNHGVVHHEAVATASNLTVGEGAVFGVAEGGGDLLYQLSTEHSLFVGDRTEWSGRGIASCLVELALALGCRFWLDEAGRLCFLPRNRDGRRHQIAPWEVLDYQENGGTQGSITVQRVSWRGGEATSGAVSLHGITDEESVHCELITSQGWAELLAGCLHQQKNGNRRVELLLAGFEPTLNLGDTLALTLGNDAKQQGRIIEITPRLAIEQATTRVVLEQRGALHHAFAAIKTAE